MKKIIQYIYLLPILFISTSVYAEDVPPRIGGDSGMIASLVDKALGYLFPIAGFLALVFIIIGGYMWIVSAGDPARVKQAQGTLTWAVLGLVFVMVILGVLRLIIDFVAK
jgi:hypothetical protein